MENFEKGYGALQSQVIINNKLVDNKSLNWKEITNKKTKKSKIILDVNDNGKIHHYKLGDNNKLSLFDLVSPINTLLDKRLETDLLNNNNNFLNTISDKSKTYKKSKSIKSKKRVNKRKSLKNNK